MGWFNDNQECHDQIYNQGLEPHEAKFSHELLGGAAAFEGMKLFEDHQRNEGKPVSHAFAKELLAGFVGAEVDKYAETKGMDYVDREKAKRHAERRAEGMYDEHYQQNYNADQYDPNQYDRPNFNY